MTASATTGSRLGSAVAAKPLTPRLRPFSGAAVVTMFGIIVVSVFLMPLGYMATTAFKGKAQLTDSTAPLWPAKPETFLYQGEELPVYEVPTDDGTHSWALLEPHRNDSL